MITPWFEELDYVESPMGPLILQRRRIAALNNQDVYEVKLNDEYLMSSLFHDAEVALSQLVLEQTKGAVLDIVVGGLGLGYTAAAALQDPRVHHLTIVEALAPVIDWHQRRIVPNGKTLTKDPRCQYLHGDFFALARSTGFAPDIPGKTVDAILLDIDHTPQLLLSEAHADFYTAEGLTSFARFLKPGGIFGLWSNEPPDTEFLTRLETVFGQAEGHTITFPNPMQNTTSTNGIYRARKA
ncbi:MAG: spermidine synthase [Kiritimatiellia bacterium]